MITDVVTATGVHTQSDNEDGGGIRSDATGVKITIIAGTVIGGILIILIIIASCCCGYEYWHYQHRQQHQESPVTYTTQNRTLGATIGHLALQTIPQSQIQPNVHPPPTYQHATTTNGYNTDNPPTYQQAISIPSYITLARQTSPHTRMAPPAYHQVQVEASGPTGTLYLPADIDPPLQQL